MKSDSFKEYRRLVKILKEKCSPGFPVAVRRVILKDYEAYCIKNKKKFLIHIDKTLSENEAISALIHEWAHAICWGHRHDAVNEEKFNAIMHDASWGVAYAEVYRIYETYFLENQLPCEHLKGS